MKKNFYSLAVAIAMLGLASCSSDEPANGSNQGDLAKGENYIAFTISNVGGDSRAITAGDYEAAVGSEGDLVANDVRFYFYDADGNAFNFAASENVNPNYSDNMVKPSEINMTKDSNGQDVAAGVLVLGKAENQGYVGATPSYVLCVANAADDAEFDKFKGKTLNEALVLTTALPTLNSTTSKFMMTSATWVKEGVKTVADDNIQAHVATTPELAQANPININLERLAAKVRATYHPAIDVQAKSDGSTKFIVDGKEATFSLAINGWQLQNTAVQANAFKDLNGTYADFTWAWNDATNKRSYWAETVPGTLANTEYDLDAVETKFTLQSFDTNNNTANIAYCYENTTDAANNAFEVFDRTNNKATAIVVKGTLSMTVNGTTTTSVDLCKWFGNYYLEETLIDMICDSYNSANKKSCTEVQFVDNAARDNSWKAQIKDGEEWIDVPNFGNILRWVDGVTSYYLNIEHRLGLPGVVRNHIYDYEFDGIVGLGFPGDEETLPDEEETFVAAHLNVLNWNLVKNKVTLE